MNDTTNTTEKPGLDPAFLADITAKVGTRAGGWELDSEGMASSPGGAWFRNPDAGVKHVGAIVAVPADHLANHAWIWAERERRAELELSLIRHLRSLSPVEVTP
mgnify:FL=1